jgi:hypothetical protein
MRSFEPPSSNGSVPFGSTAPYSSSRAASSSSPSAAAAAAAAPADAPLPSYRLTWWQAMKFNGPVPERVNGR